MTLIALDRKQAILADAKVRIMDGHTLEQIAVSHGITKRTLNTWLMAMGEEYQDLRQAWIDNLLSEAKEELDNAQDNFPLARAREQWKAATWMAERRDAQRYGQKVESKSDLTLSVTISRGLESSGNTQGRVIDMDASRERLAAPVDKADD